MKKMLFICLSGLLFYSCSETDLKEKGEVARTTFSKGTKNDNYELKKKFALTLHEAMLNSQELRKFLREEALKKFDDDYDILYNYVRDESIGQNTFRETLLKYTTETELKEIEETIPSLTIFVPTLPEKSFSAETWDTSKDIPLVAIRLLDVNETPIINSKGDSYLLDSNAIPAFPVVVVKENERVVLPSYPNYEDHIKAKATEYRARNGFRFVHYLNGGRNNVTPVDNNPKVAEAWILNGKNQNLGWQRDHIYYSINPNNPNGPLSNDYAEHITSFKLNGSGLSALRAISQNSSVQNNFNDPSLKNMLFSGNSNAPSQGSFWTDGDFEFTFYFYHHSKSAGVDSYPRALNPRATDLFDIQYSRVNLVVFNVYVVSGLTTKEINPGIYFDTWRLEDYSNKLSINVQEIDTTVERSETTTQSAKYNANFGIDPVSDALKKYGMKFGASLEEVRSVSNTRKWTDQSNDLLNVNIDFGDNVIIGEAPTNNYIYRSYSSGSGPGSGDIPGGYTLTLRPLRVQ